MAFGGGGELVRLGGVEAERFLAQGRLTGSKAFMRPLNMAVMRRGDIDRIDIIALNERLIGIKGVATMCGAKGFCFGQIAARCSGQNTAMAML